MSKPVKKKDGRGGARPGAGRKPQTPGEPLTATYCVKVSEDMLDELRALGHDWVRDTLRASLIREARR